MDEEGGVRAPWTYAWRVRRREELHQAKLDVPLGFAIAAPKRLRIVCGEETAYVTVEDVEREPELERECVSVRLGSGWSELCKQIGLRVGCCVLAYPICVGEMGLVNRGSSLLKWVCGLRRSNANQAVRARMDWSHEDHLKLPKKAAQALEKEMEEGQDKLNVYLVDSTTGQEVLGQVVRIFKALPPDGKHDPRLWCWQLQGEGWTHFHSKVIDPEAKFVELEVWPQSFGRTTRLATRVLYRKNGLPVVDHAVTYGEEDLEMAELSEEEFQGYHSDESQESVVPETQELEANLPERANGQKAMKDGPSQTGWALFRPVWHSYMPESISLKNGKLWCCDCGDKGFTVLAAMQHSAYCTKELLVSRPRKVFPWEKKALRSRKASADQSLALAARRHMLKTQNGFDLSESELIASKLGYFHCLNCGSRTISKRSSAYHISKCTKKNEDDWETRQMGWPRCPITRFCGKKKGHIGFCNASAEAVEKALDKEHERIRNHVLRYCEKMSSKFGQIEVPQARQDIINLFGEVLYEWEPNVYCKKRPTYFSFAYMLCKGTFYHQVKCEDIKQRKVFAQRGTRKGTGKYLPGSLENLLNQGPYFQVLITEDHVLPRGKGVGVVAMQEIPIGSFVMEYGGEKIGTREATRREEMYTKMELKDIYLYDMTDPWIMCPGDHMWKRSKLRTIDATLVGNFARFINHSCVPNLKSVEVAVREGHSKVVFYATRNIGIGEELTIDYDPDFKIGKYMEIDHSKRKPCLCGMGKLCRGWTF